MRTLNPQRDSSSRTSIALLLFVLVISIEKVRSEEFTYDTESQTNNVLQNIDNVLQSFLTPENIGAGSMHVQALRQKLWRILTSPALNENLILPNYDLLSDGKLLYEQPSYESKRSSLVTPPRTVFERMMSTSPYFKKYIATMVKANAIQSKPSMMGKKSIATLAKNGQLPTLQSPEENSETEQEKRNLESLARLGGIHRYIKKSLESLARHGYITSRPNDENEAYQNGKRNLGSLARNGELLNKNQQDNNYYLSRYNRNIQNLMKTGGLSNGKRNIVSLIRGNNMPYEDNEEHKRNIGTIARDWALPNHGSSWQRNEEQKRNVAALLRQDSYLHSVNRDPAIDAFPTPEADEASQSEIKRNVPSIKTGPFKYGKVFVKRSVNNKAAKPACLPKSARQKRQADEYFSEISNDFPLPDVPKSDAFDYDEFVKALTGDYLSNKKRFLGNIPLSRMTELGKFSLMGQTPPVSNATPTSPTYRRRQYLLSRTIPEETE